MAQILMTDFQLEKVKVDDVRRPEQAQSYIRTIRQQVGLVDTITPAPSPAGGGHPDNPPKPQSDSAGGPGSVHGSQSAPAPGQATPPAPPAPTPAPPPPRPSPTPQAPSNERNKLFGKTSPGIAIPPSESKAATIVAEIRSLTVKGDKSTPLAVAMLLRHLIEISDEYYRTEKTLPDTGKLGRNVLASAAHMKDSGTLTKSECDMVSRLANPGTSASSRG
jgi:hypothetical protein